MTDINKIARSYIDLWNERTPSRRREILSQNWTSDARYVDPLMSGDGHDGVDVRFSWGLGPDSGDSPIKGTDFAVLSDGRIRSITGFLDQVPAA
jgi:hypothetical protein